jgi:hypothetical protein
MKIRPGMTLLFAAVCFATTFMSCGHDHDSLYTSLADADKAGEITHGWIPDFLPKTSRNIHVLDDLSPQREWCAFEFDPTDSTTMRQDLKPVDRLSETVITRIPNPHVPWWPHSLTGNLNVDEIRRSGLQLYIITRQQASARRIQAYLVAVDWQKDRGFFFTL